MTSCTTTARNYSQKDCVEAQNISEWHRIFLAKRAVTSIRILDVGCGSGSFLKEIETRGGIGLGIDQNPRNVAFAQQHGLNALQGTLDPALPEIQSFNPDMITIFEVVEHIYDVSPLLTAARKVLSASSSKDKRLLISTPNAFNLMRAVYFLAQRHRDSHMDPLGFESAEHIRAYSYRTVIKLMQNFGFTVTKAGVLSGYSGRDDLFTRYLTPHIVVEARLLTDGVR